MEKVNFTLEQAMKSRTRTEGMAVLFP